MRLPAANAGRTTGTVVSNAGDPPRMANVDVIASSSRDRRQRREQPMIVVPGRMRVGKPTPPEFGHDLLDTVSNPTPRQPTFRAQRAEADPVIPEIGARRLDEEPRSRHGGAGQFR